VVPPAAVNAILPVCPKQSGLVPAADAVSNVGTTIVALVVLVQFFESVTVTE
jgi:hypothetical protein